MGQVCPVLCPHAGDSSEISYLAVHGALQWGGFALCCVCMQVTGEISYLVVHGALQWGGFALCCVCMQVTLVKKAT